MYVCIYDERICSLNKLLCFILKEGENTGLSSHFSQGSSAAVRNTAADVCIAMLAICYS